MKRLPPFCLWHQRDPYSPLWWDALTSTHSQRLETDSYCKWASLVSEDIVSMSVRCQGGTWSVFTFTKLISITLQADSGRPEEDLCCHSTQAGFVPGSVNHYLLIFDEYFVGAKDYKLSNFSFAIWIFSCFFNPLWQLSECLWVVAENKTFGGIISGFHHGFSPSSDICVDKTMADN